MHFQSDFFDFNQQNSSNNLMWSDKFLSLEEIGLLESPIEITSLATDCQSSTCTNSNSNQSNADVKASGKRKNIRKMKSVRKISKQSSNILKLWLQQNKKNPYPNKKQKEMLADQTNMTVVQISTWFANARRRLKKENRLTWIPRNRSGIFANCQVVHNAENDKRSEFSKCCCLKKRFEESCCSFKDDKLTSDWNFAMPSNSEEQKRSSSESRVVLYTSSSGNDTEFDLMTSSSCSTSQLDHSFLPSENFCDQLETHINSLSENNSYQTDHNLNYAMQQCSNSFFTEYNTSSEIDDESHAHLDSCYQQQTQFNFGSESRNDFLRSSDKIWPTCPLYNSSCQFNNCDVVLTSIPAKLSNSQFFTTSIHSRATKQY